MQNRLDEMLQRLLAQVPDWRTVLSPAEIRLVTLRLEGVGFRTLGRAAGLTGAGVRLKLYGKGPHRRRHGGILGRLHGHLQAQRKGLHPPQCG